ncbi:hypothetical protein [Xylanimonas sp. McL0601]|uniref:hypothetical protein n=1 Tax=Xylanimonas sp. McL0601 TaxID=3414739 RepID=UPI003CF1897C
MSTTISVEVLETDESRNVTVAQAGTEPLAAVAATTLGPVAAIAAVASVAAGLAHYAATGLHLPDELIEAILFTLLGGAQIVWPTLLRNGRRWVLVAGIVINALTVIGWAVSRTVGLPFGDDAGTVEPVGLLDVGSVLAELVVVTAAVVLLRRRPPSMADPAAPADMP